MKLIMFLLIGITLSSCSAQWHFDRAIRKDASIVDTVYKDTVITTDIIYKDTITVVYRDTIEHIYIDTVTIKGYRDTIDIRKFNRNFFNTNSFYFERISDSLFSVYTEDIKLVIDTVFKTFLDTNFVVYYDTVIHHKQPFRYEVSTYTRPQKESRIERYKRKIVDVLAILGLISIIFVILKLTK